MVARSDQSLNLRRDELDRMFDGDFRAIKAFEGIITAANTIRQTDIVAIGDTANSAEASSNLALAEIVRIADALEAIAARPIGQHNNSVTTDYIDFPITGPHETRERRVQWNDDDGTVDVGLYNGVVLQVGQELHYYAKNTSGSTIANGSPVVVTGTLGASGKLEIGPAIGDNSVESRYFIGAATQDIPDNDFGYVTSFGAVRHFDTSAWNDGDLLYVSATTAGEWTTTKPIPPNWQQPHAIVIHAAVNGTILVRREQDHPLIGPEYTQTRAISASASVVSDDYLLLVDASGGAVTVTLPAVANSLGRKLAIKKTDASANAVTIDGNASETIDGAATVATTTQYDVFEIVCDGSAWWII